MSRRRQVRRMIRKAHPLIAFFILGLGCGGATDAEEPHRPPPPTTEGAEGSEERADDGRQFFALPDDGSLGDLEDLLMRRRDEGTPVLSVIIHTARSAGADDAQNYLDAVSRLVRRLHLEAEVLIGAPADSSHLTLVTRHPSPLGP
jgi:hypothetical protein